MDRVAYCFILSPSHANQMSASTRFLLLPRVSSHRISSPFGVVSVHCSLVKPRFPVTRLKSTHRPNLLLPIKSSNVHQSSSDDGEPSDLQSSSDDGKDDESGSKKVDRRPFEVEIHPFVFTVVNFFRVLGLMTIYVALSKQKIGYIVLFGAFFFKIHSTGKSYLNIRKDVQKVNEKVKEGYKDNKLDVDLVITGLSSSIDAKPESNSELMTLLSGMESRQLLILEKIEWLEKRGGTGGSPGDSKP